MDGEHAGGLGELLDERSQYQRQYDVRFRRAQRAVGEAVEGGYGDQLEHEGQAQGDRQTVDEHALHRQERLPFMDLGCSYPKHVQDGGHEGYDDDDDQFQGGKGHERPNYGPTR